MRTIAVVVAMCLAMVGSWGCRRESGDTPNAPVDPRSAQRRGVEAVPPSDPISPKEPGPASEPADINPFTTAARPEGTIRMGRAVESDGRVPDAERTDVFMTYDPIHFSIEGGALADGDLAVHDESGERVWSDHEVLSPGKAYLNFAIRPGGLRPGSYRATITTAQGQLDQHRFTVSDGGA